MTTPSDIRDTTARFNQPRDLWQDGYRAGELDACRHMAKLCGICAASGAFGALLFVAVALAWLA